MNEPVVAIRDYYKAFSALDLDACARFFTRPCLFIGDQGAFPAANREDLARVLGPIIDALKTIDYQRSEFVEPQLTTLAENTTLVRGVPHGIESRGQSLSECPSVT